MNQSSYFPSSRILLTGLLSALTAMVMTATAQQRNSGDRPSQRQADFEAQAEAMRSDFYAYRDSVVQDYEAYEAQLRKEFDDYVSSIAAVWGVDSALTDTPVRWVEYGDDRQSRSVVDFDRGTVDVEVAVDDNESLETVTEKLNAAVERMMSSRGTTCPWTSQVEKSSPIAVRPVLEGLLDLSSYDLNVDTTGLSALTYPKSGRPAAPAPVRRGRDLAASQKPAQQPAAPSGNKRLGEEREAARKEAAERRAASLERKPAETPSDTDSRETRAAEKSKSLREVAQQVVKQSKTAVSRVTGTDGKQRKVVKVEMKMVTDNLSKAAAMYRDIVEKYSRVYEIEQPLIFAIIEQESRFNPEATSHIPAYGLMQLVPRSGGADAYRFVYGQEGVPTRAFLFNPDNNIRLGTAYLRVLFNQFAKVANAECRRLCVIASYNTGAGNVSRAFIGSAKLSNAFSSINALGYDALYKHLTTRLSTDEARNYVSGVSRRREKYLKQ